MNEQILAVQRMQDYIAAHLDEQISMTDLSREALFSPWYAYRLFESMTGLTPSCYIRRLRLANAAKRLKNSQVKIVDVAFDLGFESADGFTRAFHREFGILPREFAKNPIPITLFVPYGVKYREIIKEKRKMAKVENVFIQLIRKPERLCIIKRGINADEYFSYCNEVGCDVYGKLLSMDSLCGEPVCMWLPQKYKKPGTSTYVMGVEVEKDYKGIIPEGFDTIELPEAEYLMFQGEPFKDEDFEEAIINLQNAIDKYDPSVIGYAWDKSNPHIQLVPNGERGYIELYPVVRK